MVRILFSKHLSSAMKIMRVFPETGVFNQLKKKQFFFYMFLLEEINKQVSFFSLS